MSPTPQPRPQPPRLQITVNTKIRLLTRIAYGFHNAQAMIAIAMLSLGHHKPALPGRT